MKRILIISVILALFAALIPVAAFADAPPIVNGSGNIPSSMSLSITAPTGGINYGPFAMGANPASGWASTNGDGNVNFNPGIDTGATWTLSAQTVDDGNGSYLVGKMYSADTVPSPRYLDNQMHISFNNGATTDTALPGPATLTGSASGYTYYALSGYQVITLGDAEAGAGNYTIVIELSAQITP